MNTRILAAAGLAVVAAAGVLYWATRPAAPVPTPPPAITAPPPAPAPQTAPTPAPPPSAVPADCLLPGPPPVPPDGSTANEAEMKQAHDIIQAFVKSLEAYQACRTTQADYPRKGLTQEQRDQWIAQGNAAVDEANDLASAFAAQLKIFKARGQKK